MSNSRISKLKYLLNDLPPGFIVDTAWLNKSGLTLSPYKIMFIKDGLNASSVEYTGGLSKMVHHRIGYLGK